MYSFLGQLIFTITALSPVGFTYAWAVHRSQPDAAMIAAGISAALFILAYMFVKTAQARHERAEIKPQSIEAADSENIVFILIYVSPLFTASLAEINWDIILPTFVILAAVFATGYNYHFNPVLGLLRWHAYRVTDAAGVTYVLFTRRQMRSALDTLTVVQLTEYVVVEVDKPNDSKSSGSLWKSWRRHG